MSLRPILDTERVPDQPGLLSEILYQENNSSNVGRVEGLSLKQWVGVGLFFVSLQEPGVPWDKFLTLQTEEARERVNGNFS